VLAEYFVVLLPFFVTLGGWVIDAFCCARVFALSLCTMYNFLF